MAITYDKKMLKRLHKNVNGGNKKYAFKLALLSTSIYFIVMLGLMYLIKSKTEDGFVFNFEFVAFWFVGSLFMFVVYYISNIKGWKDQKAIYDESIKYFEKHDPAFLKELDF